MAGDEWYYSKGGERLGPVTTAQLKELAAKGELAPSDLIWKEGMADWIGASKTQNLFPSRTSIPPPLPLPSRAPRPEQPASDGSGVELAEEIADDEVELAEEALAADADPRPSRTGFTRPRCRFRFRGR